MTSKNKSNLDVRYRLKSMVMARILAETTVFLIMLALPLVALAIGKFFEISLAWRVIICILPIISLLFLPAYGFITWVVTVTKEGLIARSIFQKKKLLWNELRSIKRRSNWNWQRYVVEGENGDLSFPIWLKDADKLVSTIKSRLPGGGASKPNPFQKFSQDPIALSFQFVRAFFGIALVVVFWLFFSELYIEHQTSQNDILILLVFCIILSGCVLWRTFVIMLMPKKVEITPPNLIIRTLFFSREYSWDEVKEIKASIPLLPDGFVIRTKKHSYLVDNGMNAADELVSAIQQKLPPKTEPDKNSKSKKKRKEK